MPKKDINIIKNDNMNNEIEKIIVHGAREHNLKNVNLEIPRDKLVVITGLSGSGKSTLAFDTLYSEGQRRYVECLSAYARQFLGMMKKPDVDRIEGLSPAISIEQKSLSKNPRSTVGTVTEIYDYLRLLYAKIGTQFCTDCHVPVVKQSTDQITDEILARNNGKKIQILAPIVRGRKGHYKELFETLLKNGFTRVRIDGEIELLKSGMHLERYKIHNIELVIDRCKAEESQQHRIAESIELAANRGEGSLMLLIEDGFGWNEKFYSTTYSCPDCGKSYESLAPNMFSFNSPYGACTNCEGLGYKKDFTIELAITDKDKSIWKGAVDAIGKRKDTWLWKQLIAVAKQENIDLNKPAHELNESELLILFNGNNSDIDLSYAFSDSKTMNYKQKFIGIFPTLTHQYENSPSSSVRRKLEKYMSSSVCPECNGGRLKKANLSVFINERNIHQVSDLDIEGALEYFANLSDILSERQMKIADLILKEIKSRLEFLVNVGLPYLSISRSVRTLSGGESQRIRLASQIGSKLVGIMYVLDEPSIGLHQHDNDKLIESLKGLRDLGNTVIVVEHDRAMIEQSDYLVDIGPGAGVHGGEIIISDDSHNINSLTDKIIDASWTAKYLTNKLKIEYPEVRRNGKQESLVLKGASGNNLQNLTLKLPLGRMICITGKSGSGKSSLINDTLYPILSRHFFNSTKIPLAYESISGLENIDKVIEIDQAPIGRTPRSNPATYTGIFTHIRDFFALLPESRIRGYKPGRFSFNVADGRCEDCEGAGIKKIEMNFLPEVYVECDTCGGKRYNKETLTIKYKSKTISDVLDMTIDEATEFFADIPKIRRKLNTLIDVGLTYIKLGQQAPTLSGGEAQRVKLATELSKKSTGKTLYLLDEPTTGLHFEDIRILLKLLAKLTDKGNTVVVIEHNLDVIKCADWIVDLGPEGGSKGGRIVAEGTPEKVARSRNSLTAKYLKDELNR